MKFIALARFRPRFFSQLKLKQLPQMKRLFDETVSSRLPEPFARYSSDSQGRTPWYILRSLVATRYSISIILKALSKVFQLAGAVSISARFSVVSKMTTNRRESKRFL